MRDRLYYSRDAERRVRQQQLVMMLVIAALSLALGGLVALLFAPRTGEEVRRQLGEQIDTAYNSGRELAEQMRTNVEERVQDARR